MRIDKVIEILDSRKPPESEQDFEDFDTAMETAINLLKTYHDNRLNDPLTLEELREMDGEPVWIVCGAFADWRIPEFIDMGAYKGFIKFTDRSAEPIEDYGKNWLAYRRKPEEGTT